ncbi:hypothetical protein CYLTODRAFT_495506 [Cylindrobasidium torrendii FP15055 ss-10]|uniref:FERM domain-containing protein n=1 Tax=Cylindrobasidium torrendii FP15055 ss-10 TaxID=1314674 RepID=A0A0D7AU39_9AGAR|nr:hypothetical protein CYLTODRAFT_495506 [Cylindrobasidium torrendii FP15055 ss-10]
MPSPPPANVWLLVPSEELDEVEPRAKRAIWKLVYSPTRLVDCPDRAVTLKGILGLHNGVFLHERLMDCGVKTWRGLLALAMVHLMDEEHKQLIRLALGMKDERNWRILGYILRGLQVEEVKRIDPNHFGAEMCGRHERAASIRPRIMAIWKNMAEPEVEPGERPISNGIWRIYYRMQAYSRD